MTGVTQSIADAREARKRARHRWSAPDRVSSELTIRTCVKCGCVRHSNHEWTAGNPMARHWSEYFSERNPEQRLAVMPECEG